MKTIKEQVLKHLKENFVFNLPSNELHKNHFLLAIDLTEQLTRKECEKEIEKAYVKANNLWNKDNRLKPKEHNFYLVEFKKYILENLKKKVKKE